MGRRNATQAHAIEIEIDEEGNVVGEIEGLAGPGCEGLLDWLAELGQVEVDRRTPDFYRRQAVQRRQSVGGRR